MNSKREALLYYCLFVAVLAISMKVSIPCKSYATPATKVVVKVEVLTNDDENEYKCN